MLSSAITIYIYKVDPHAIHKMTFTAEVCKAFFNFKMELNKTNGMVPAIYEYICKLRKGDPNLFYSIDRRMARESCSCNKPRDFLALLQAGWTNVDVMTDSQWTAIAYVFYISDKVDSLARSLLHSNDYQEFKKLAETATIDYMEFKFGESLSKFSWDLFCLSEKCVAVGETEEFTNTSVIIICLASVYMLSKILW